MKTKIKVTILFGAVVLAFLAAACSNLVVETPQEEASQEASQGETGRILVNIKVAGGDTLEPVQSRIGAGALARTVVPTGFGLSTFSKFEADFTATSGGTTQNAVTLTGGTNDISLEVGTYTVKITAYIGSGPYTAAAEGSQAGVVVSLGGTTPVSILLGPISTGGPGTFSYSVNVSTAITSGSLAVKTSAGGDVGDGTKNLLGSTNNTGSISLNPGYYQVLINLTKSGQGAGYPEIIHIYTGLTSSLSASFADADFTALAAVSDFALSGKFTKPLTAQAPAESLNGDQYTGTISWSPTVSGTFAASTVYTATVTLSPKPGYTFDGVAANAFTYTDATSASNSLGSGTVTVVFPATQNNSGSAGTAYSVDDGVIAVTADPSDLTVTQGGDDLVLTVPDGYTVTGWYIDGAIAAALGTGLQATLDPDNYDAKAHRVSVFATKGGRPYSWTEVFTVEAAGGSGTALGPFNAADFVAAAQGITVNTAETPVTIQLDSSVDLSTSSADIINLINGMTASAMNNKYIVLDLSQRNDTTIAGHGSSYAFNWAFAVPSVVGIIFPGTLTSIGGSLLNTEATGSTSGLRSVTIPASVTSIGARSFLTCPSLTRVTFAGGGVSTMSTNRFPNSFETCYNDQITKAGTYVYSAGSWSKE